MHATLFLPGAVPRLLSKVEFETLAPQQAGRYLTLDFESAAQPLRSLLGTDIPAEVLANGATYLIVGPANAADYDFAPVPSAGSHFTRLTGIELDADELVGPLLIFEV